MSTKVAVILQNDQFYPDSDAAITFAELANEPFLSPKTMQHIDNLGGFEITVQPYCRGLGQGAIRNNVIRIPVRV